MIIKIAVFAICASFFCILLKQDFKPGAVMLSAACCCAVFLMCISLTDRFLSGLESVKKLSGVNGECITVIVKTLAVAYATSFGADICSDAGEKAIAAAVETAGKLIMLSMALPMLGGIFETISKMLG